MAKKKSISKYNKLLTGNSNYFRVGGPVVLNNARTVVPGFAPEIQGMQGVYMSPSTPSVQTQEIRAAQQEASLGSSNVSKDNNSDWGAGGLAGGIGFLANGITNMVNNISASDVKATKNRLIENTANAQMRGQSWGDSFDALANDMASTATIGNVDKYDLGAKKAGAIVTESLTEGLKGSMAGFGMGSAIQGMSGGGASSASTASSNTSKNSKAYGGSIYPMQSNKYMGGGPIGAIVGGVLGTGMSLAGNLIKNHKAANAAKEVNEQIAYTNAFNERSMLNRAENLRDIQLGMLESNYAALGGPLAGNGIDWPDGLITIDAGGSHESNPNEGVIMGMDEEGNPNLVEEGETIFDDYVFSRRLKVPKAIRNKYKLRDNITFAEASKKMAKEAEERPNDPISQKGLRTFMADLANAQENLKANMNKGKGNKYAKGGSISDLRYVPALGSAIGTIAALAKSPDYEMADSLIKEGYNITAPTVAFNPLGDYIEERPMDRLFYINQMNAQSGATRRNLMNMAGLNRGNAIAGLLTSDNSYLNQLGTFARQAEEYNYNNRLQARTFNRATNQYNSEGMLKANIANAENKIKTSSLGLETISKGYQLRQQARDTRDAAISANLTNLFDNIGNIGWEEYQRRAIESNPALLGYYNDRTGWFRRNKQSKNGGFLTIKKK